MTAGSNLRTMREKLGLTMREVEVASKNLALEHGSDDYLLPISCLCAIETKGVIPSIHRLYSFAIIYRLDFRELFSWYGMDLSQAARALETGAPPSSHYSRTLANIETVYMPVRLNPSFDPRNTVNLSSIVEQWGTVPLSHLERLSKVRYTYAYIGSEDLTMYPILLPGSFIQIDESRNRVYHSGWRSQWDRPIYLVETRNGHICSWCTQLRDKIVIESHPLSSVPVRVFKHPEEAEVIGQVVGVAMKLASLRRDGLVSTPRTTSALSSKILGQSQSNKER